MRLGIFAKTFPGSDPMTVLGGAQAAGFSSVQYNMACSGLAAMPDAIADSVAKAVAAAAQSHGVKVSAVSGTYNMIHPDPAVRATGLARLEVLAAACSAMGTGMVTLCTGTRDPHDQWRHHPDNGRPEAWRDLLVEMERAIAIAERHQVKLGIEPELANVVDSAAKAQLLIDTLQSDALAVVLDPANLFEKVSLEEQRHVVAAAIDLLGDRIVMGHAKDRTVDGDFATAGTGVLDYRHYVARLRSVGFDGDLITHGLQADEAAGVAWFLEKMLA